MGPESRKEKQLKIVYVSSEVAPFAKTGGLADVSGALPASLARLGHKVMVVMPLYRSVKEGGFELKEWKFPLEIPHRGKWIKEKVYFLDLESGLSIYFIKRDEYFDRSFLYGTADGDYFDNGERFVFFSRAAVELAKAMAVNPDIVHCHDWQSGLIPVYLKSLYRNDRDFRKSKIVFTIHNLGYQGVFPVECFETSGLPPELFSLNGLEYYGKMNVMKGGILFSDLITTVSQTYSREIQTPEYGHGLEGVLKERSRDIHGVLNGVDYTIWNPETDPLISTNYSAGNLTGKAKNKEELFRIFELEEPVTSPLIGIISRLADQKGFDILAEGLKDLVKRDIRLVVLGKGEAKYEKLFVSIAQKYRGRIGVSIAFDNALAHQIEAGADMFLMPSRYEPCGLNQMYSLKYGTVPVVRATGGLEDSVVDFDPDTRMGNGFKFTTYTSAALVEAVDRAVSVFRQKETWKRLVHNAMEEDFSWKRAAEKYEEIYRLALGHV